MKRSVLVLTMTMLLSACVGGPRATSAPAFHALDGSARPGAALDAEIERLMKAAAVPGLALALIENGQVVYARAYGRADVARGVPLQTDTIMYGASLTKAAFAHLVLQLVDEGVLELDAPLPRQLKKPLPDYPDFADLRADPRWQAVTPRMLLSHSSGLLNWRWINEDRKLDFKYAPGSRYVYSGEGIQIMQLIVEERSGRKLGPLMQERIFDRFKMANTSMVWRDDFASHVTAHYGPDGALLEHKKRRNARAAGSMDTTLADYAKFLAAVLRGEGLSAASQAAMLSPQLAIVSPQQFPSHWPGETDAHRALGLSAGLGWPVFNSSAGPAFFKEGSDDGTNNLALGFIKQRKGILMLSNSSNAPRMFYPAVEALLGHSCLPWFWMGYIPYDRPELLDPKARAQPPAMAGCG
ncbi:MAG: serine hydrolase domain-containing protein [Pseudomonadota bacterium]